jgi:hypothetical protein
MVSNILMDQSVVLDFFRGPCKKDFALSRTKQPSSYGMHKQCISEMETLKYYHIVAYLATMHRDLDLLFDLLNKYNQQL